MLDFKEELKDKLRENLLSCRASLQRDEVELYSGHVFDVLMQCSYFLKAKSILFYYSHNNEVDLMRAMKYALAHNKRALLPRIDPQDNQLYLHQIENVDNNLEQGRYGIMQPREKCPMVSPNNVDVFLIPGIAFDARGMRLGYGQGYYDCLFEGVQAGKGCKIGVAYPWQIVDEIPRENHDILLDFILTEKGIMGCKI